MICCMQLIDDIFIWVDRCNEKRRHNYLIPWWWIVLRSLSLLRSNPSLTEIVAGFLRQKIAANWNCGWIWVGALDFLISGWRTITDRSQGSWISNSCRKALASWMRCFCAKLLNCWYSHRLRRGLLSLSLSSSNCCGSPNGIVTQKFKKVIMAILLWTCWSIVIRVSAESPVRHQCVRDWLLQSALQTLQ